MTAAICEVGSATFLLSPPPDPRFPPPNLLISQSPNLRAKPPLGAIFQFPNLPIFERPMVPCTGESPPLGQSSNLPFIFRLYRQEA
jgi:hypothetical protein